MASSSKSFTTPHEGDLRLTRIANRSGLSFSFMPNGAIFAIEHVRDQQRIMVNQVLGSPIAGAMGRLYLRAGGAEPMTLPMIGPEAPCRTGAADDRFIWRGEQNGLRHQVCLWLHPDSDAWFWRVDIENRRREELPVDAVLVQDLGLGERGFLMGNEAYASQYLDHFVARHPIMNDVLMSRQNLSQRGAHPWTAHGCLDGAAGFATDFRDFMGPAHRDTDHFAVPFGTRLPSTPLQYETGCAAIQSGAATIAPRTTVSWTFFGLYKSDHPAASSEADLAEIDAVERASRAWVEQKASFRAPTRSFLHEAPAAVAEPVDSQETRQRYPRRDHVEGADSLQLSFFTPGKSHSRHVVLRDKERLVTRRHGALLRSGDGMLPADDLLCATCWMHGVFGAQLAIGNTSFHKLFSVSRDPYNITRGSGLRMLVDLGDGWRLLTVPSAFEMGLGDCRWIYRFARKTIVVSAVVSSDEPAMQWRVSVEGDACRFLVFGHLVLGERELETAGRIEIDAQGKSFVFRPDPDGLWGHRYPDAAYHLVTGAPDQVEAVGGDELLYPDGKRRSGAYAAIRTRRTKGFAFAVVGSMTDPKRAEALARKYAGDVDPATMLDRSDRAWRKITRGVRIRNAKGDAKAVDTIFPWLTHDAMIHLTAPHGLEQYSGAAWGTRDVCQGPLELLLSLEHDGPANEMLRIVFAQQYEKQGDWPQWFMLEPYSAIQDKEAHGDVIVWPLKALCDYIEATGDFAFLEEPIAWRREDNFEKTPRRDPIETHIAKLIATVRERFVPGTHLLRYGNGDWNDSLQPVDPALRDWMVSSWTVALLYQQLHRYAEILRLAGRAKSAMAHDSLAAAMKKDFTRFLIRDGVVAGYGVFRPDGRAPKLLLHPSDERTGLSFSLIPMTQGIIGGVFTPAQARRHLAVIREHLLFPDGARLMEKPLAYHGGIETIFRRAESAAFFGREVGLMYVHSHLRYAEAMSVLGEREALWNALLIANPIAVTDRLANASLRQRNAYFSSSDAAFRDRYQASEQWESVRTGGVPADGGWRIYSSGPGLYTYLLVQHVFGLRRRFGERIVEARLPESEHALSLRGLPPATKSKSPVKSARSVVPKHSTCVPPKSLWTATASSGDPRLAIDDRYASAWVSKPSKTTWLKIDLGVVATIGGLEVYWGKQAPVVHAFESSLDGKAWASLCRSRHGEGGQDVFAFPPVAAQFVRWACETPSPEQGWEVVEINLYGPTEAASVMEPGRVSALGHAAIKLPVGESVTVDFGHVRSPLGAFIEWGKDYGTVFSVHLSDDGESFREVGRIETGDGDSDSFWWRSTTSRFFRLTVHEASSPEGAVINELKLRILNKDRMPIGQLERAALAGRGDLYPQSLLGRQVYWTALGEFDHAEEALFDEYSNLEPQRGSGQVTPLLRLDGALYGAPASATFRQFLAEGSLPIPTAVWSAQDVELQTTAVAHGGEALVEYHLANRGAATRKGALVLAVRPVQINPYWQHGGHAMIEAIAVDGRRLLVNDRTYAAFAVEPDAVTVADFDGGDVVRLIETGPQQTPRTLRSASGLLSAACEFDFSLAPGETIAFVMSSPMRNGVTPNADRAFSAIRDHVVMRWREKLGPRRITVGDKEVSDTVEAQTALILVNATRTAFKPGPRNYDRIWIRDGSSQALALLWSGLIEEAKDYVLWYSQRIYENGLVPPILNMDGTINRGYGSDIEFDAQGEFVGIAADIYRISKDRAFLDSIFEAAVRATRFIEELCGRTNALHGRDTSFHGLLAPSISHEGYSKPSYSYWDNYFALSAWRNCEYLARKIGDKDVAAHAKAKGKAFAANLTRSIRMTARRMKTDLIPGSADRDDVDPTSTSIAFEPCRVEDVLPTELIAATYDRAAARTRAISAPDFKGNYSPYDLRNLNAFVSLGRYDDAFRLLTAMLACRRPRGWEGWAEVVWSEMRSPEYIGDMPHTWIGAEFATAIRRMLLRENGNTLELFRAVPDAWWEGQGIRLRDLPTSFGVANLTASRTHSQATVALELMGPAPKRITFRHPGAKEARADGRLCDIRDDVVSAPNFKQLVVDF